MSNHLQIGEWEMSQDVPRPRLPDDVKTALLLAQDALRWCSGSPDFNEGGQAREGWLAVGGPSDALDAIDTVLKGAEARSRSLNGAA